MQLLYHCSYNYSLIALKSVQLLICIIHTHISVTNDFLNQLFISVRFVHAWFLEIDFICDMCACMCVPVHHPLRLLITSGMMSYDIDTVGLVKQVLQLLHAWQL